MKIDYLGLNSALLLSSCMALGKFLNLSVIWFPHLTNEIDIYTS